MPETTAHQSVLLDESIGLLRPGRGGVYVDATLGLGGHAQTILNASDAVRLIGLDQDEEALDVAKRRLGQFGSRVQFFHANFSEISNVVNRAGERKVDGIIADLGVSSMQLDSESRGFSFLHDMTLDMRMDQNSGGPTAADLLATLSSDELADIIYRFGEERHSRKIARWIVERREAGDPVTTTADLAALVKRAVRTRPSDKIHPATRTFQALRIAVNRELDILDGFIADSIDLLKTDGTLAVITFHSLEDRIVKRAFQRFSGKCQCPPRIPRCVCGAVKSVEILTRKPVVPSEREMSENPRSRSAKLRACRKI